VAEQVHSSTANTIQDPEVSAPGRDVFRLWTYGIAIAVIGAAFSWRYPLIGNTQHLVDIGKLAKYGKPEFVGFCLGIGGMFVFYLLGIRETRKLTVREATLPVFATGAAQAIAIVWMYPVSAIDVFLYAVHSRLFTEYGLNPIASRPIDYSTDPYMLFASKSLMGDVSSKGPLWNLIAAPATFFGGDGIGTALALFKMLAILAAFACAACIFLTLRQVRPEAAATGALIFLWNPMVLWEGIGNAHNDLVMMAFVLGAFYAWYARRDVLVIPLLVLGAMIKYEPLLLIPFAGLALLMRAPNWRARASVTMWSAIGSAIALAVSFFPFYDLGAVRHSFKVQSGRYITSPQAAAISQLHDRYNVDDLKHYMNLIGFAAVGLTLLVGAILIFKNPDRFPRLSFELTFIFLLIATSSVRNWYAIWIIGLAAILPLGWPTWRAIAWAFGSVAYYGFSIWVRDWWKVNFDTINTVQIAIMLGPAVLVTFGELVAALIRQRPHRVVRVFSKAEAPALSGQ
jgi:Glycosyltransferase family 87